MYKLLLCWRYLRTRYLALVCIVSVMLGVATLIVVNSVMSGFSTKLRDRLHGLLSDVVIETADYQGFPDADGKMRQIQQDPFLGPRVECLTPTVEVFAMLQYRYNEVPVTRPVRLIGIEPESRARVGGFKEFLGSESNRRNPTFSLSDEAVRRYEDNHRFDHLRVLQEPQRPLAPGEKPPPDPPPSDPHIPQGAFVGHAIAHYRRRDVGKDDPNKEICLLRPGDDVILTTVSGARLAPVYDRFVVCDYIKTEMSEYDSNYVYVPLEHLQRLRAMEGRVTSIQLKLKDYRDAKAVVARLQEMFPMDHGYEVQTWEDKQGPLLAAIRIEKGILNVLLFLIVAVAGFGILAIFSMIVVEKTRDIGILKALGASNWGVMKIFLGYGLLLGVVGAALGTALGITFTVYINEIEAVLARLTGQEIFDRSVYYFDSIPTNIDPLSVVLVNVGAVAIAVVFSVLPAARAAMLHPVRALRYE